MEIRSAILPLIVLSYLSGCVYIRINKKTGESKPLCFLQKAYNILVIIMLICGSIWSLYWKLNLLNQNNIPILGILSIISELFLLIGLIIQSMVIAFRLSNLKKILSNMNQVEDILNLNTKQHYGYIRRFLLVILSLLFVLATTLWMFNIMAWSNEKSFDFPKLYICETIMRFRVTIHSLELFVFIILIKERFKLVNQSLPIVVENEYQLKNMNIPEINCVIHKSIPTVRELSRIHNMLYESSLYANRFFGMSILILCLQVFFSIIHNAIYIVHLRCISLSQTIAQQNISNFTITLTILWLLFDFSLVVILCSLCEYTVQEANETGILAYKLLLDDNVPTDIGQDLQQIAGQIVGSVTSYIIVVLEFYNLTPPTTTYNNITMVSNHTRHHWNNHNH